MIAPTSATIEPGERSMWREMIANVIAIATTVASPAFWATIDCSVRLFSHAGSSAQKVTVAPTVISPRNQTSR